MVSDFRPRLPTTRRLLPVYHVARAMRRLQQHGVFAPERSWRCCQTCGWPLFRRASRMGVFHEQDAERFDRRGALQEELRLAWQGEGQRIKAVFEAFGFEMYWSGERIGVWPRRTGA